MWIADGKWIQSGEHHFCSECENWALYDEYDMENEKLTPYCPFCGARMPEIRIEDEDEDEDEDEE